MDTPDGYVNAADVGPLYKIVGPAGECLNGGTGSWPLPVDGEPGEWWRIDGRLEACRNGLHLASAAQLGHWMSGGRGQVVYRVETDGPILDAGDKYVAGAVRLLPRINPAPDPERLQALAVKRDAVHRVARERFARIEKRAGKALAVTIPAQWQAYLRANWATLPAAHPGRAYQDALKAATAAYDAIIGPAKDRANAATRRADAAYATAAAYEVMPE